jgi:hypothetical protein
VVGGVRGGVSGLVMMKAEVGNTITHGVKVKEFSVTAQDAGLSLKQGQVGDVR